MHNASLRCAIVICALTVTFLQAPAFADPYLERFGVSARLKGMAATGVAISNDYSSVHVNPANLPYCAYNQLAFELASLGTSITTTVDGNPVASEQLGSAAMSQFGACFKLPYNIGVGFFLNFNIANPVALHVKTLDDRIRYILYDASLAIPSLGIGIGYAPLKWFSFGFSSSFSAKSILSQNLFFTLPSEPSSIDTQVDVSPLFAIVAGITVKPLEGFNAALTYRFHRFSKFEGTTPLQIKASSFNFETTQQIESVVGFSPHQIALGLSYEIIKGLTVATDFTWYHWSAYTSPFLRVTSNKDSTLALIAPKFPDDEEFNFHDIYVPTFGIEYVWNDLISVRTGYGYRMSPTPSPQGIANLIDTGAHMVSLGNGYNVRFKKVTISTDIFFIFHFFPTTDFVRPFEDRKQTITSHGVAWNAGANLTLHY